MNFQSSGSCYEKYFKLSGHFMSITKKECRDVNWLNSSLNVISIFDINGKEDVIRMCCKFCGIIHVFLYCTLQCTM